MSVRAGTKAPDFELQAFHNGETKTVKLSDYAGHEFCSAGIGGCAGPLSRSPACVSRWIALG